MIVCAHVDKAYGKARVLKDVCAQFAPGKIHGLVGRNGSGKTMLFKCICGLVPFDRGEILVDGKAVGKQIEIPDGVGAIIDAPGFLPYYGAYRNLALMASIKKLARRQDIRQAIQTVGLDADDRKHVSKFSMGMRQRLAIAQAIMENPSILILDEPMNGLDNQGVKDMRALFTRLRQEGKTLLIASHNPLDIEAMCDTVWAMDAGVLTHVRG